ncbi:hypothetical protein H2199_007639 [Coniosporium tulheliwenetii]|uniref:Uncharacterized protein n=1 Tax=Coniosporium tulheliwenetii TaxID=3383036 RepID=A0ACC2YQ36_9PEZI|nr:hypothetical protein H2199_007639 [Cladosporium sp. JES 115]
MSGVVALRPPKLASEQSAFGHSPVQGKDRSQDLLALADAQSSVLSDSLDEFRYLRVPEFSTTSRRGMGTFEMAPARSEHPQQAADSTALWTHLPALVLAAWQDLASAAYAQVATTCPQDGVCFGLNIPENTASSGNGDIFFQISAPTTYSWVALGQGSGMSGSNIFVIYTSASGNNVTLSPRLGQGHRMPNYNSAAQVTLLEGSGVTDGVMTANVRYHRPIRSNGSIYRLAQRLAERVGWKLDK